MRPIPNSPVVYSPSGSWCFSTVFFYIDTGISLRWIATVAAGPSAIAAWIGAWLVFFMGCKGSIAAVT